MNFLPIGDGEDTHTRGSGEVVSEVSPSEEVDHRGEVVPEVNPVVEVDVSEGMVPKVNLPGEIDGSVDRTVHWVLSSPDDSELEDRQTGLSEGHDVSDWVSEPFDSASVIGSDRSLEDSDVPPIINCRHSAELHPVVIAHEEVSTDALPVCTQPLGFEDTVARTRRGRAVNPPERLICEMNEQVLDTSESTVNSFIYLVKSLF